MDDNPPAVREQRAQDRVRRPTPPAAASPRQPRPCRGRPRGDVPRGVAYVKCELGDRYTGERERVAAVDFVQHIAGCVRNTSGRC